jgi:hypothetical protein
VGALDCLELFKKSKSLIFRLFIEIAQNCSNVVANLILQARERFFTMFSTTFSHSLWIARCSVAARIVLIIVERFIEARFGMVRLLNKDGRVSCHLTAYSEKGVTVGSRLAALSLIVRLSSI